MKYTAVVAIAGLLAIGGTTYGLASTSTTSDEAHSVVEAATNNCVFCHGSDGVAPYSIWPSIAGMDAEYLERQLNGFAAGPDGPRGSTHAGQMHAISAWLDTGQRAALARHFSRQAPPAWKPTDENELGRDLFAQGQGAVLACASCHGTAGEGDPNLSAPRLAGQSARYTAAQLRAYADGSRRDENSGMAAIAAAMTEEQIAAVAAYLQPTGRNEHEHEQ